MDNILKLSEDGKTIIGVNNKSITHITIPEGVTTIGHRVFLGCSALQCIDIPNSVTTIGYYVFYGCSALQCINVSDDNPNYTSVDGILFNKQLSTIIQFPEGGNIEVYNIPNSVTTIGYGAFYGCSSLQSIDIPNSVTTIGDGAFYGCSSLQSIDIPNSVTTIGYLAFSGCSSLQSIDIPNSVTSIGERAFSRCSSLQSIVIPNSVTKIGDNAFRNCSALQSINISDDNPNYTSVDGILFNKELSTIIKLPERGKIEVYNIPKSITAIEEWAFGGYSALKSINVSDDNPNYTSVDGILFNKQLSTIIKFPQGGNIEVYNIPNSVTTIGYGAFYGCSSLQSIDIPNSVTTIGNSAFWGCSLLQSIDIPNSVKTIGGCAFWGCSALQCIDIPNSVTTIGYGAFECCSALKSIHLHWTNVDSFRFIFKDTFGKNNKVNFEECTLYVPPGTRWEYRHHTVFGQFKNIEIEKQ